VGLYELQVQLKLRALTFHPEERKEQRKNIKEEKKKFSILQREKVMQKKNIRVYKRLQAPQEEGMISTTASLPSVVKPRFIEPVGESQTSEGDAC
jgi:hypothetical protein